MVRPVPCSCLLAAIVVWHWPHFSPDSGRKRSVVPPVPGHGLALRGTALGALPARGPSLAANAASARPGCTKRSTRRGSLPGRRWLLRVKGSVGPCVREAGCARTAMPLRTRPQSVQDLSFRKPIWYQPRPNYSDAAVPVAEEQASAQRGRRAKRVVSLQPRRSCFRDGPRGNPASET